jgi:hypothetical protein
MAALPPSRARFFLLLQPLRSTQLVRFPMPVLTLHRHLVTQLGSAPTHRHDTTRLSLITRLSAAPHFLPIISIVVLVQTPVRTHMSILTSKFIFSTLVIALIGFPFLSFGHIYLCGAFWDAPMTGTDSKASASCSPKLNKSLFLFHIYREEPLSMSPPTLPRTEGPVITNMVSLLASRLHRATLRRRWTTRTLMSILQRITRLLVNLIPRLVLFYRYSIVHIWVPFTNPHPLVSLAHKFEHPGQSFGPDCCIESRTEHKPIFREGSS